MKIDLLKIWKDTWVSTEHERKEYDLSTSDTWRVASPKRNPEDRDWWYTHGYKFLENWTTWRKENPHLQIYRLPDGTPAIELDMTPEVNGVTIKMAIDRVFLNTNTGEPFILDLKTGKSTPSSGLQLGFYAYGIRKVYGIDIKRGYYWNARRMELSEPFDLAAYSDSKIESLVSMFEKARQENIFMPNFNHCIMCGYKDTCEWNTKGEM